MKIYVDLDGVLADFDTHHENTFGVRSDKLLDNVDWKKIEGVKDYYLSIPPMKDMWTLWRYVAKYEPTILTGVPSSINEAADNKRAWVRKYLGIDVPVITCLSKEKCLNAQPGDVLIDDWDKYQSLWVEKGGVWITHTDAATTIERLKQLGL